MILNKFKLAQALLVLLGLLGAGRPAAPGAKDKPAATPASAPAGDAELAGRVLDEAGKPIAGAKLSLWSGPPRVSMSLAALDPSRPGVVGTPWSGKGKAQNAGETGKDGRFRVKFDTDPDRRVRLVARAKGYAAAWVSLRRRPTGEVVLRLSKEVPIQGLRHCRPLAVRFERMIRTAAPARRRPLNLARQMPGEK